LSQIEILVDRKRVMGELEELAQFSDAPPPAVTRVLLTEPDRLSRDFFRQRCEAAQLDVRSDAAGNLFARWVGKDPGQPAVATGSHFDAIPHSGRYDGTVGVLGGLEAIRSLQTAGYQPQRSIELIMFTAEEPTRHGIGCLGSRLMAGVLSPSVADGLTDDEGESFSETRQTAGYVGSLESALVAKETYAFFVELHIEQGPILEQRGLSIGVVTDIAAPAALRVTYEGQGGHAGAVLMAERRDALLPAAELALLVDRAARELGGEDSVATTGVLDVFPRAINSIPSRSVLEIDIRDVQLERRDKIFDEIRIRAEQIGERHQQRTIVDVISQDPPANCSAEIVNTIVDVCKHLGASHQTMVSRAYHDCLFMAQICPASMIFIPCRDGISHRPDEFASPEAIQTGISVLAHTLARLSSK